MSYYMQRSRWESLMQRMGLPKSSRMYLDLVGVYTEEHRYYHNINHIDACLGHFYVLKELAERPTEVEMAIWFHDAVYDPKSKTNEQDSAAWCCDFLLNHGYDAESTKRIEDLINITLHNATPVTHDQMLLLDIDLSILATDPVDFEKYDTNIRYEYSWVPEDVYREKRKEVLSAFLNRESIYQLPQLRDLWEDRARRNLELAISKL